MEEKQLFKYTPITAQEAFNMHMSQLLTNSINGEAVSFSECKNIGDVAYFILGFEQWYKIEPCRIVDIAEAYRVLDEATDKGD